MLVAVNPTRSAAALEQHHPHDRSGAGGSLHLWRRRPGPNRPL